MKDTISRRWCEELTARCEALGLQGRVVYGHRGFWFLGSNGNTPPTHLDTQRTSKQKLMSKLSELPVLFKRFGLLREKEATP